MQSSMPSGTVKILQFFLGLYKFFFNSACEFVIFHISFVSFVFHFSEMRNLNHELLSIKSSQRVLHMKLEEVVQNQSQILNILLKTLPSSTDICEIDAIFPQPKKTVEELEEFDETLSNDVNFRRKIVSPLLRIWMFQKFFFLFLLLGPIRYLRNRKTCKPCFGHVTDKADPAVELIF